MPEDPRMKAVAERIAKDKIGFLMHLAVYLCVNVFFVGIWLLTGGLSQTPWFLFPAAAWGIGLAIHFAAVYLGPGFEQRLAEREYARLSGRGPPSP